MQRAFGVVPVLSHKAEIELTENNRHAILKQDGKSIVVNLVKPMEAQFEVLPQTDA